ncbi:MAG: hypothetical protein AVDCRST_MAG87-3234, partial [uncultured Thermomicrobiales bacterium]
PPDVACGRVVNVIRFIDGVRLWLHCVAFWCGARDLRGSAMIRLFGAKMAHSRSARGMAEALLVRHNCRGSDGA